MNNKETKENILKKKGAILYIKCTKNTIRLTLLDLHYKPLISLTPGQIGYTKGQRSIPLGAFELTSKMLEKIEELDYKYIYKLYFNGKSYNRFQIIKALKKTPLKIYKISEITKFPFNGCRQKKFRRLKRLPT